MYCGGPGMPFHTCFQTFVLLCTHIVRHNLCHTGPLSCSYLKYLDAERIGGKYLVQPLSHGENALCIALHCALCIALNCADIMPDGTLGRVLAMNFWQHLLLSRIGWFKLMPHAAFCKTLPQMRFKQNAEYKIQTKHNIKYKTQSLIFKRSIKTGKF